MCGVRRWLTSLCGGLDLGQGLALLESALLLQAHDLEAVKVRQRRPLRLLVSLLGPVGLLPLLVDFGLLPSLLDGGAPRAAGQVGQNELGQDAVGKGDGLPGHSQARV